MLLVGKKKKIKVYLETKQALNTFDHFLKDYLFGELKTKLIEIGASSIEIHIDWLPNIKEVGIQCKYKNQYVDILVDENEVSFAMDEDEPDDKESYEYNKNCNSSEIYSLLEKLLKS